MRIILFLFITLFQGFCADVKHVFTNQDETGNFIELGKDLPPSLDIKAAQIKVDGVTLEEGYERNMEFWVAGYLQFSLPSAPVEEVSLDEYSPTGEFLETKKYKGTQASLKIEMVTKDGQNLFMGYQKIKARLVEGKTGVYDVHFQLVYKMLNDELGKILPTLDVSKIEVRMSFVQKDKAEASIGQAQRSPTSVSSTAPATPASAAAPASDKDSSPAVAAQTMAEQPKTESVKAPEQNPVPVASSASESMTTSASSAASSTLAPATTAP